MSNMTQDEFEVMVAGRLGYTVDQWRAQGYISIPCDCDYKEGTHWRIDMIDREEAKHEIL